MAKLMKYNPITSMMEDISSGKYIDVDIDEQLDTASINPVQNKIVAQKINKLDEDSVRHVDFIETYENFDTIPAGMIYGLKSIATTGILEITDDTTNIVYIVGINDGKLYIKAKEV